MERRGTNLMRISCGEIIKFQLIDAFVYKSAEIQTITLSLSLLYIIHDIQRFRNY